MDFTLENFGEFIKAERLKRGLAVIDVAEGVGYSIQHIYNIESGRRIASLETILNLLNYFGFDLVFHAEEMKR